MSWVVWAVVLLAQNFSSALVSRARASILSNGTWFWAQFIAIDKITKLIGRGDWWATGGTLTFYVTFTVLGSLMAHHLSMKYFERRFANAEGK